MPTIKGQNGINSVAITEGDHETEAKKDYARLFNTPSDTGLGTSATGSEPQSSSEKGATSGSFSGFQKTEKYKQEFWKHSKTIASALGVLVGLIIIGVVFWFIGFSNKISSDNAKIITEIENLKQQVEQLRTDKNRDTDNLQKQIDRLLPNPMSQNQ